MRKVLHMPSNTARDTHILPRLARPLFVSFQEHPIPTPTELAAQSARERIAESGPGAEIARRIFAEDLRSSFNAFLETAPTVEILTLFELFEFTAHHSNGPTSEGQCSIIEAFLAMLGLDPATILSADLQRVPIRRG